MSTGRSHHNVDWPLTSLDTQQKLKKTAHFADILNHYLISTQLLTIWLYVLLYISHAAKIALEVIRLRVNHFIAPQIAEEQFGFVCGKGTTDATIVLCNIIEKAVKRTMQKHLIQWTTMRYGIH